MSHTRKRGPLARLRRPKKTRRIAQDGDSSDDSCSLSTVFTTPAERCKTFAAGGESHSFIVVVKFKKREAGTFITGMVHAEEHIHNKWLFAGLDTIDNTERASNGCENQHAWEVNGPDLSGRAGYMPDDTLTWCIHQTVERKYSVTYPNGLPLLYHDPTQNPTVSASELLGTLLTFDPPPGVEAFGVSAVSDEVMKCVWGDHLYHDRRLYRLGFRRRKRTKGAAVMYTTRDIVDFSKLLHTNQKNEQRKNTRKKNLKK